MLIDYIHVGKERDAGKEGGGGGGMAFRPNTPAKYERDCCNVPIFFTPRNNTRDAFIRWFRRQRDHHQADDRTAYCSITGATTSKGLMGLAGEDLEARCLLFWTEDLKVLFTASLLAFNPCKI